MHYRRLLVSILVACSVAACGDGEGCPETDAGTTFQGEAYELAGLWQFASFSMKDAETSAVTTLTRDGTSASVRGDALFAATGPTSGILSIRLVRLVEGLLADSVLVQEHLVDIEGDRWLIHTNTGGTEVFLRTIEGDRFTLVLDESDPRNAGESGVYTSGIVLQRVQPMSRTYGSWNLVTLTEASGTTTAGACTARSADWAIIEQNVLIDPRLGVHQDTTIRAYSDDGCHTLTGTMRSEGAGFAEENGDQVTLFLEGDGDPVTVTFSFAITEPNMTMTRTACLPLPGCEMNTPTSVTLVRAEP